MILEDSPEITKWISCCNHGNTSHDFFIGGVDISFVKGDNENACAALISCYNSICSLQEINNHSWFMVYYTTFNNISVISWQSVLLEEETGVPGEKKRPVASH
jgi:hypothetical protein